VCYTKGFIRTKEQRKRLERSISMKYVCTVISVADISAARKFYEELFGLEVYQDYGKNIAFTCGLALQQDFDWLVNIPKEKVLKKSNNAEVVFEEQNFDGFLNKLKEYSEIEYLGEVIEHSWGQRVIRFYDLDEHLIEVGEDMQMVVKRFLASGMTMEEVSAKMDVSIEDLTKLLNS
jgi:catechol 2,3-dioxygenase-like lactoylglutathione lyase family enzyme